MAGLVEKLSPSASSEEVGMVLAISLFVARMLLCEECEDGVLYPVRSGRPFGYQAERDG